MRCLHDARLELRKIRVRGGRGNVVLRPALRWRLCVVMGLC